MRASAAARPTPVPAPVTIAILGVVMRFLRLRVGLRFGGSDGAPAYNDAGADTARLDDSGEPAPSQALHLPSWHLRATHIASSRPGSASPRPVKKQRINKEHSSRFDVNHALSTKAEQFPQETRSCGTVGSIRRWQLSGWVSQLRRLLRPRLSCWDWAGLTATPAAAAVTVTRRFMVPPAVAVVTVLTALPMVQHRLTPAFTATAGPMALSVTSATTPTAPPVAAAAGTALTVTRRFMVPPAAAADMVPTATRPITASPAPAAPVATTATAVMRLRGSRRDRTHTRRTPRGL